jgi:prevent-host-death family protein
MQPRVSAARSACPVEASCATRSNTGATDAFIGPSKCCRRIVWVVVRVNMHEAKRQLSRLVDLAEGGEEIIIERSGRPVARLVALPRRRPVAQAFGALRGRVELTDDFDGLPAELVEHFS